MIMTIHLAKATIINKLRTGIEPTAIRRSGPAPLTEAESEMVAAAGGPSSGGMGSSGGGTTGDGGHGGGTNFFLR
jgi:hypothetical protein